MATGDAHAHGCVSNGGVQQILAMHGCDSKPWCGAVGYVFTSIACTLRLRMYAAAQV